MWHFHAESYLILSSKCWQPAKIVRIENESKRDEQSSNKRTNEICWVYAKQKCIKTRLSRANRIINGLSEISHTNEWNTPVISDKVAFWHEICIKLDFVVFSCSENRLITPPTLRFKSFFHSPSLHWNGLVASFCQLGFLSQNHIQIHFHSISNESFLRKSWHSFKLNYFNPFRLGFLCVSTQ